MAATPAPDRGLFGPGSVTWRIMGEPIMWVGGLRAMYLQALHPRTMRATWQNTAFARHGEAWGRFGRTLEYVRCRTYGSTEEAERAGRRVRRIHASLTGTDADGSVIRLDEPELLTWVHCGEIASYANIAARSGMGLSAAELDEFVAEQRRSAALVGLDPASVPGCMAELAVYYEAMRPAVYACAEARQAFLRSYVPEVPWPFTGLRLVIPPLNTLAFASLPRWARRKYGAPGSPVTDLSTTVALRALHQATTRIPRQLLGMPMAA
ncbi:MAG TPA: oxygenase MpaB family protein [Streptosporangiaceae bacterium]|nr:oxygenase MpaB family protein [Streptosporangiaceae bacterium]